VVAGRGPPVLRAGWPYGAGFAGFRCTGWGAGLRADVPESPADPGGGEPARRGGPFPGQAQVGGQGPGEAELGVGGDDQPGPPVGGGRVTDGRGGPAEDLLRVGDRLRGFDRLPAEAELTNPRHPLAGQRVPVMSAYRRSGGMWLMVMLPDGFPAAVPVDDTDLGGSCVAATGTTILSVAGIRRLRELAAAMAAKERDR
jgi:hypothetical protein